MTKIDGMRIGSATLHGSAIDTRQPQVNVVAVEIPALEEPVTFVLSFSGSPSEVGTRPFVPGRAAVRFERQ